MAEENNNVQAPLLTPEQVAELSNSGQLTSDTASMVAPTEETPLSPEELQEMENPLPWEEQLSQDMQNTDFSQYDTSHLQEEMIQEEEAKKDNKLLQDMLKTDFSKYNDEQWQQEQRDLRDLEAQQAKDEEQRDLEAQQAKDEEQIAVDAEIKKASIMDQLSSLKAAEDAEAEQRQKLIEEQEAIFADINDLKEEAKDTQVDDFWSEASTGTKIMAALAIGLGAAAGVQRGDGQNHGLQMMMNIVNQQAKAKQQSFKNQLALKSAVLDKVQSKLRVMDSKTQSRVKSAQIANMMNQIEMEKQKNDIAMKQELERSRLRNKLRSREATVTEEQLMYDSLDKQQKEQANNLRKDYEKNLKDLKIDALIPTAEDMKEFTNSPSAAGDIALIFAYMKSLDPNSVVRESEFKVAAEAGSATQRAAAIANKILTGERVSDSIRRDFLKRAQGMVKNKLKAAQKVSSRFNDLAISQGIPPQVGLGIKDYSLAAIMPEEAAYDFAMKHTGMSKKQLDKTMKATNKDIYTILEELRR